MHSEIDFEQQKIIIHINLYQKVPNKKLFYKIIKKHLYLHINNNSLELNFFRNDSQFAI